MVSEPRRSDVADLGVGVAGAFCYGLTILFSRIVAKEHLGAPTALAVRFGIAGGLLLVVQAALGRPLLPPRGERGRVLLLGLGLYAVESTFFFMALERGTAAAVALIFYSYPAVVATVEIALGWIRPRRAIFVALALSVGGAAGVAIGGGRVAITVAGIACALGAVVAFSTYAIAGSRLLDRTDSLSGATWIALGAATGTALFGAVSGQLRTPSTAGWSALGANGVATAAAFTLFFVALGRLGASRTSVVMAVEAVSGVVLAAVFLGEAVRPVVALGGAAVLAGAVVAGLAGPPHAPGEPAGATDLPGP